MKNKKMKKGTVDFTMLMALFLLVFIGLIMVYSSSWPEALREYDDALYYLKKQTFFALLGFIGMFIAMQIDYNIWYKHAFKIYLLGLATALLLLTPLGTEVNGAKRWVRLGPIGFMPGDVIKIGSIIYMAKFLVIKEKVIKSLKHGTIPALMIIGFSFLSIFLQNDLGTALILGITLMALLFVGGMNLGHLSVMVLGALMGIGAIAYKFTTSTSKGGNFRYKRIQTFIDPFSDPQGAGFQMIQSLYSIGSGGVFGLGLGKSRQKFFYIPESHNDFIFAIIVEELGLVGSGIIILLYVVLIWRGVVIARNAPNLYGTYLATGLTALVAVQTLIHIAVVTSSIPATGVTLPFISYGGTSLIIFVTAIGILLNISRYKEE